MDEPRLPGAGWYRDPGAPQQLRRWDGHQWTPWYQPSPGPVISYDIAAPVPMLGLSPHRWSAIIGAAALVAAIGAAGFGVLELSLVLTGRPVPGVGSWLIFPTVLVFFAMLTCTISVQNGRLRARYGRVGMRRPGVQEVFGGLSVRAKVVLGLFLALGELGGLASIYSVPDPGTAVGATRLAAGFALFTYTVTGVVNGAEWLRCRGSRREVT